jgi:hypothetical protein
MFAIPSQSLILVLEADACKYNAPPLSSAVLPLKLQSSIALSVLSKEIAPPYS